MPNTMISFAALVADLREVVIPQIAASMGISEDEYLGQLSQEFCAMTAGDVDYRAPQL